MATMLWGYKLKNDIVSLKKAECQLTEPSITLGHQHVDIRMSLTEYKVFDTTQDIIMKCANSDPNSETMH